MTPKFDWCKPGDHVTRMLAGVIAQDMVVVQVKDGVIWAGNGVVMDVDGPNECWRFDVVTGAEIDEYFGWGPPPKMTGSFLKDTRTAN